MQFVDSHNVYHHYQYHFSFTRLNRAFTCMNQPQVLAITVWGAKCNMQLFASKGLCNGASKMTSFQHKVGNQHDTSHQSKKKATQTHNPTLTNAFHHRSFMDVHGPSSIPLAPAPPRAGPGGPGRTASLPVVACTAVIEAEEPWTSPNPVTGRWENLQKTLVF